MSSHDPAGGARLRYPLRLTGWLTLSALAISVSVGVGLLLVTRGALAERLEERLSGLTERVEAALDDEGRDVAGALDRMEQALSHAGRPELEQLLAGGPAAAPVAGRLALIAALDLLEVSDEGGRLVSTWPEERTGLVDPRLADLPRGPELTGLETADGRRPGVRAVREVQVGNRRLRFVAGRAIDRSWLDRVSATDPVLLLIEDGKMLDNGRGSVLAPALVTLIDGAGAQRRGDVQDDSGTRFRAGWVALQNRRGDPVATLAVAVDREPGRRFYARSVRAVAGIVLVATILAALGAMAISRSLARPVESFVRAVDAIAAGEADYTFPASAQDEFEHLKGSVSRLQRALDLQRKRSAAAERVAAWRDVARHVAHEVKNPLAPIRLTVENLQRARQRSAPGFDGLFEEGSRTILEEVDQLSRLVGEFSEFARLPPPQRRPTDLGVLLDGVLDLYASESELEIVRIHAGPALDSLDLDPDQISQALKNVVGNAVEAMDGVSMKTIRVRTGVEDEMARIEITDSGPGLSDESVPRVFEPYFTTKDRGTGLGMALTYRIITEHGGVVHAENSEEGGARIVIRLPFGGPQGETR